MITLVFGLIHGFGFGRYFSLIVTEEDALLDLFSFALGVEAAQIAIVIGVLLVRLFVLNVIKIEKAKWNLIVGSMILSQAILMMFQKAPFRLRYRAALPFVSLIIPFVYFTKPLYILSAESPHFYK